MQRETNWASIWSFVSMCVVILILIGSVTWLADTPEVEADVNIDYGRVANIIRDEVSVLETPVEVNVEENEQVSEIYDKLFEEDLTEAEAEKLVREEIESKDFLKEVHAELDDVDDYKDITRVFVKDLEVDLNGQKADVEVELKAYYFIDNDEEETEKALLEAIFKVKYLDVDEDYSDAEVKNYDVELIKVYD